MPLTATTTPEPASDATSPELCEPSIVTVEVVTTGDQYWITEQATMPSDLSALPKVSGLCGSVSDDLIFSWTAGIDYFPRDFDSAYGPSQTVHYRWPAQTSEGLEPFSPDFGDVVRGGTLTLTATTQINDLPYSGRTTVTILGTNPSPGTLLSYLSSQFPGSYYTLWRIAQAESDLRQFNEDGHPNWSTDKQYGVGIMQITHPAPTDDEVWNWKRNADAADRKLQTAYAAARNWPNSLATSREFSSAVDAYNAAREKVRQPKLTRVTVPEFSSGNLMCNLLQREQNAIRLYNGAGGTDNLGLPLHEYKLAYDPTVDLLELDVDEHEGTARAQWVRVAANERPRGSGEPDYVSKVLSRPTPGLCR